MTHTPHDALFKAVFSLPEHASGELRAVLPPRLSRRIDWSTLTLQGGSFVDEALKERHSDLLYGVQLEREALLLYLLFEHQSTVDGLMAFRLLRYMARLWERHLEERPGEPLPLVVPIVVSHADGGWTAATRFEELFSLPGHASDVLPFVPRFTYVVDDLAQTTTPELEARLLSSLAELALHLFRNLRRGPRDAPRRGERSSPQERARKRGLGSVVWGIGGSCSPLPRQRREKHRRVRDTGAAGERGDALRAAQHGRDRSP